uniref:JmjC domain-containing protein n=1 Tax=Lotharella oceanica TaxID=641309 RepID=A0A7S2TRK7_9EUKA
MKYYGDYPLCIKEVDGEMVRIPLRMFFDYVKATSADYPVYLCEKEIPAPLLEDYANPIPFQDDLYQQVLPPPDDGDAEHPWLAYLLIGGRGSGSPVHKDPIGSGAWNALLHGKKRWCLFPPGTNKTLLGMTDGDSQPPAYWWQDVYPNIKNHPEVTNIEVIQKAGEIMFVPAGWYHVVMNLETSIAVTQNFVLPSMLTHAMKTLMKENPKLSKAFLMRLSKIRPELMTPLRATLLADAIKSKKPPVVVGESWRKKTVEKDARANRRYDAVKDTGLPGAATLHIPAKERALKEADPKPIGISPENELACLKAERLALEKERALLEQERKMKEAEDGNTRNDPDDPPGGGGGGGASGGGSGVATSAKGGANLGRPSPEARTSSWRRRKKKTQYLFR